MPCSTRGTVAVGGADDPSLRSGLELLCEFVLILRLFFLLFPFFLFLFLTLVVFALFFFLFFLTAVVADELVVGYRGVEDFDAVLAGHSERLAHLGENVVNERIKRDIRAGAVGAREPRGVLLPD